MATSKRNDFNPYELCTQTYTQYSHLNTENSKKYLLWRDNDFFTTFDKYYFALKRLKTREFWQNTNVFGFKTAEIVRMHKTCLTSQFLRLSLARFSREMAYLPSRKNLANESMRAACAAAYWATVVESVYSTPKIFGVEFGNSWRSGVRSFTFTSVGASRKSTCCRFNLFLESYL